RFLRNLFYWATYFRQWTSSQRREFFRWKWRRLKQRFGFGTRTAQMSSTLSDLADDIGDLVDLSAFSKEERAVWESHIRALLNYHPQPFPGRVHLFRSPGHPLWCSFDPDYGWGELAKGGVDVRIIPGAHEKVLEEPCVRILAEQLEQLLRKQGAE